MSKEAIWTEIMDAEFCYTTACMQQCVYDINERNGWWDNRNALIASGIPGAEEIVVIGCLGLVDTEIGTR